jgi:hypothetical protein
MTITQQELQSLLHYEPATGIFTRLVTNNRKFKVGDIAGGLKNDGYIHIKIDGQMHRAHRLAWLYMTGKFPDEIDHINHVRNDNKWINLRNVSRQENTKNRSIPEGNVSGFMGVRMHKPSGKWMSRIKQKHLGYFTNLSDAVLARLNAEEKQHYHHNHGVRV